MSELNFPELEKWAINLAKQAGKLIREGRESNLIESEFKNGTELVTQMDVQSEKQILSAIREAFPDHQIVAEESANDASNINFQLPTWIVDPIDGTVNYAHNHSQVGICIALAMEEEIKIGVVYNPFTDEVFHAVKGQGACLNGNKIKAGGKTELKRCVVATGFPYEKTEISQITKRLEGILSHCADIRRLGSAALDLCWVACGRMDAYYERDIKLWDIAAGWLIAEEAGVTCGHIQPSEQENSVFLVEDILVSGSEISYRQLQEILQTADQQSLN